MSTIPTASMSQPRASPSSGTQPSSCRAARRCSRGTRRYRKGMNPACSFPYLRNARRTKPMNKHEEKCCKKKQRGKRNRQQLIQSFHFDDGLPYLRAAILARSRFFVRDRSARFSSYLNEKMVTHFGVKWEIASLSKGMQAK